MLIWLDDSIANALGATPSGASLMGLSTIFQAIYRGEHLVLANRTLLDILASEGSMSQADRRLAKAQASRLTEIGLLEPVFSRRITVVHNGGPPIEFIAPNWRIQLDELGRQGLRPTMLLGEDIVDVQLFLEAAHHYLIQQNLHRLITPRADKRGAGGKSNVCRSFAETVRDGSAWCFCVTDSDRASHVCAEGRLTRYIDKVLVDHEKSVVCGHQVLPTCEVENLLPINIVSDAVDNLHDNTVKDAWQNYTCVLKIPPHIHAHTDLKEGMTLWRIKKLGDHGPSRAIWDAEINRLSEINGTDRDCKFGKCLKKNKSANCACEVIPGISDKLAETVLNYMNKNSRAAVAKRIFTSLNGDEWLNLGKAVAEWTCGCATKLI